LRRELNQINNTIHAQPFPRLFSRLTLFAKSTPFPAQATSLENLKPLSSTRPNNGSITSGAG
jgi:hypothetical protein